MSHLNRLNLLKFLAIRPNGVVLSRNCSKAVAKSDAKEAEEDSAPVVLMQDDEEDQEERRKRLEKIRNKSRLSKAHRNFLMEQVPYPDGPESWIHQTLKYKRGLFGKYGLASGIDPRICYPTATEKADKEEYERVAYPFTLQEMQQANAESREKKRQKIMQKEETIANKLSKLDTWLADMNARIAKKEAEAREIKERKERLVEEVRRHFGYKVDPRDEKFKEMLAQKEKEDKRMRKEARKKQRDEKVMEKFLKMEKKAEAKKAQAKEEEDSDDENDQKPKKS
ncbi:large ribosomal subunit protein mL64 [Culicoides brevitarsis]|uniref:large ribosomal subunit protein mL64 n=1 Tax=Culicoides brevitarsis TaxID=469753 RepID=UPI00307C15C2